MSSLDQSMFRSLKKLVGKVCRQHKGELTAASGCSQGPYRKDII